jgi:hypothetical protein
MEHSSWLVAHSVNEHREKRIHEMREIGSITISLHLWRSRTFLFGLAATIVLLLGLLAAKPAQAVTYPVNDAGDASDTDLSDNACVTNPSTKSGACTLRAAIEQANATPGVDTINFFLPDDPNIPGPEVKTISPSSALPDLTEAVTINGYSQLGASENTQKQGTDAVLLIELNGTNAGSAASGLSLKASNVTIKGLAINRFGGHGISIDGSDTRVEGNFIGVDAGGISSLNLGNGISGVSIASGSNNHIGGTLEAHNIISGNAQSGVEIGSSANKVDGNLIGTKQDGVSPRGNSGDGVLIEGFNNTIGAANIISFNRGNGVVVENDELSTGNRILGNFISSNSGLGIDLNNDGRTPNDPKDPDKGPNNLQNFPVLNTASVSSGKTTVTGTLNSTRRKTFTIQFFFNVPGDPEGRAFLGHQINVKTNRKGTGSFTFTADRDVSGQTITATATNEATGDTSEFSSTVSLS